MMEQIFPFTAEFSDNMVTILNDEDIMGTPHWSDKTLMERYHEQSGKKPYVSHKDRLESLKKAEE